MENSNQVEIVKKALDLEKSISRAKDELSKLSSENFSSCPKPPERETFQKITPPITPSIKFNWILAAVLTLFFIFGGVLYYFCYYKPKREQEIEDIRNSDEYKQLCDVAETEYAQKQGEADRFYETRKTEHETKTLPQYQKELKDWTAYQNKKISEVTSNLKNAQDKLDDLYTKTKIVPMQYRKIPALIYIYNLISTSNYDITYAIDSYDKKEQRKLEEAKLRKQEEANQLAEEANQLAYEQASLLDEQNEIASKARRDANVTSVVGAIQRHNINKHTKKK